MWIDDEGVAHTVAVPDPASLISKEFRTSLDALVSSHRREIEGLLSEVEAKISGDDHSGLVPSAGEAAFKDVPAPATLLQGSPRTVHDLKCALGNTSMRWRLDAVLALEDYID